MGRKADSTSIKRGILDDFSFHDWISGRLTTLTCSMAQYIEQERAKEVGKLLSIGCFRPASIASTPDVLFWKAIINGELPAKTCIKALETGKFDSPRKALEQAIKNSQIGYRHSGREHSELAPGVYPFVEITIQDKKCLQMPIIANEKDRRIAINPFYFPARHIFDGLETIPSSLDLNDIWHFSSNVKRALSSIDRVLPRMGSEISRLINYIIPLKANSDRAYSGSISSLPTMAFIAGGIKDIRILSEMILHEFLHSKLFLLQHWDPLFLCMDDALWGGVKLYSPWRECKRPLQGLLHGAFVFSGVSKYWQKVSLRPGDKASRRAATAAAESFVASLSLLKCSALSDWGRKLVLALIEQNLYVLDSIYGWEQLRAWSPDKNIADNDVRTVFQLMQDYSRLSLQ